MFGSGMKESGEGVVQIRNIKPSVFRMLLEFIYTDKMDDFPLDTQVLYCQLY
jgi:hypothetical protein